MNHVFFFRYRCLSELQRSIDSGFIFSQCVTRPKSLNDFLISLSAEANGVSRTLAQHEGAFCVLIFAELICEARPLLRRRSNESRVFNTDSG